MLHLFAVLMVLIYSTHPKASTSGAHLGLCLLFHRPDSGGGTMQPSENQQK